MPLPVALQLYSVRQDAAADLAGVLERVASWGYDGVEFAGFHGHDPRDVRRMLDDASLRCAGAHLGIDQLEGAALPVTLEAMAVVGCPFLIVPSVPAAMRDSIGAAERTAERFAALADAVEPHGVLAGFHCHYDDVRPLEPGGGVERSAWYVIGRGTPGSFILQYDTANGMDGGAEPVAPIHDFPARAVTLHLKEYVTGDARGRGGHGLACIGEGDVPWAQVIRAARGVGGTRWLIVEQEGHPTLSPMAAAERSLQGLRRYTAS